jgi:hypothetical protein
MNKAIVTKHRMASLFTALSLIVSPAAAYSDMTQQEMPGTQESQYVVAIAAPTATPTTAPSPAGYQTPRLPSGTDYLMPRPLTPISPMPSPYPYRSPEPKPSPSVSPSPQPSPSPSASPDPQPSESPIPYAPIPELGENPEEPEESGQLPDIETQPLDPKVTLRTWLSDDLVLVNPGGDINAAVLSNDQVKREDLRGMYFFAKIMEGPARGTATVSKGIVNYKPEEGFLGQDKVTYKLCMKDSEWSTSETCLDQTATLRINVEPAAPTTGLDISLRHDLHKTVQGPDGRWYAMIAIDVKNYHGTHGDVFIMLQPKNSNYSTDYRIARGVYAYEGDPTSSYRYVWQDGTYYAIVDDINPNENYDIVADIRILDEAGIVVDFAQIGGELKSDKVYESPTFSLANHRPLMTKRGTEVYVELKGTDFYLRTLKSYYSQHHHGEVSGSAIIRFADGKYLEAFGLIDKDGFMKLTFGSAYQAYLERGVPYTVEFTMRGITSSYHDGTSGPWLFGMTREIVPVAETVGITDVPNQYNIIQEGAFRTFTTQIVDAPRGARVNVTLKFFNPDGAANNTAGRALKLWTDGDGKLKFYIPSDIWGELAYEISAVPEGYESRAMKMTGLVNIWRPQDTKPQLRLSSAGYGDQYRAVFTANIMGFNPARHRADVKVTVTAKDGTKTEYTVPLRLRTDGSLHAVLEDVNIEGGVSVEAVLHVYDVWDLNSTDLIPPITAEMTGPYQFWV